MAIVFDWTGVPDQVRTQQDRMSFYAALHANGINFHPDDDPEDWVDVETGAPTLREEDVDRICELMDQAFEVPGSAYEDGLRLLNERMRLNVGGDEHQG